jgi:hypothetical protein
MSFEQGPLEPMKQLELQDGSISGCFGENLEINAGEKAGNTLKRYSIHPKISCFSSSTSLF